ncbi:MAG: ATP/GTP-binding protein [Nibricoccus sp.]
MLLSFSLSNFRSFFGEQTLSLVASPRHSDHPEHLVTVPNLEQKLLPIAVIYGANGAGKSNLINGLRFVEQLVLEGTEPKSKIGSKPFLLGKDTAQKESAFEIRFVNEQHVFTFGFTLNDSTILTEWLSLMSGDKEQSIYERVTNTDNSVKIEAGKVLTDLKHGDHSKIVALAEIGTRSNQLFLATIRENIDDISQGPLVKAALDWFASVLTIIEAESHFGGLAKWLTEDDVFKEFAGDFLREASTGVGALRASNIKLSEEQLKNMPASIAKLIEEAAERKENSSFAFGDDDTELIVEKGKDSQLSLRVIHSIHKRSDGEIAVLPFEEESDGTKRLARLIPALYKAKKQNHVFVVDELDRSLHPSLSKKFLECFLRLCGGKESQLIVTTHESNLMDLDILRRDELWFAEKDAASASSLYSLSDFKIRKDLKIDKGYLQGRFGAIPFLGNLDQLCTGPKSR